MSRVLGFTIEIQGTQVAVQNATDLKLAIKELEKQLLATTDNDAYQRIEQELLRLRAAQQTVNQETRNYIADLRAASTASGSYAQLNNQLNNLRNSYRALSEAERNGAVGRETIANIRRLDVELRRIDASMGNFQRNVGNYPQTILGLFSNVLPGLNSVTNGLSQITAASDATSKAMIGSFLAFTTIGAIGKPLIDAAAQAETAKVNFQALSGSIIEGSELYNNLAELAKKTPFELPQLQTGAKSLLAFGFAVKEIPPQLSVLGDIAAGVGTEKLPQIILAFGQVKAATKLTGNELRQFTEAGIPLLDALAKQGGISVRKVRDEISAGKISFEEVQSALKSLTSEGGQFFGLMEKQSKTLTGQMSNLSDTLGQTAAQLGQIFLPLIKSTVEGFSGIVGSISKFLGISPNLNNELETQRSKFVTLVTSLKDSNLSMTAKTKIISTLKAEYPDLIKGVNLQTASEAELNKIIAAGNIDFRKRIELNRQKAEIDNTASRLDQYAAREQEQLKQLFDYEYNLSKATGDLQKKNIQDLIDRQKKYIAATRGNIANVVQQAEYQQKALDLIAGKAADTKVKTVEELSDKELKAQDRANKKQQKSKADFDKSEIEYQKQTNSLLLALAKQLQDERVGLVEDEEKQKRQAAQQAFDDRINSLKKEQEGILLAQEKQRDEIRQFYGRNSKQERDFNEKVLIQNKQLKVFYREIEIAAVQEHAAKIQKIENDSAEKKQKEAERIEKDRQDFIKKSVLDEIQYTETANAELLNTTESYYQDLLNQTQENEAERLRIIEEASLKVYNQKKTALQSEILLLETDLKNLEQIGGSRDFVADLKEKAAKLNAELLKLDKTRTKEVAKEGKERNDLQKKQIKEQIDKTIQYFDYIKDAANGVGDLLKEISQAQVDALTQQIERQSSALEDLEKRMDKTTGAQRVQLQRQIEQQKQALEVSNKQREEAEKKAARQNKAIQTVNAVVNTAAGVARALAVGNVIEAIAAGFFGAIQVATIQAQAFAKGGLVELSGERINARSNIRERSNGDNILAFVRRGEVVLNEHQQAALGGARTFRKIGVPGFADGGQVGDLLPSPNANFIQQAQQGNNRETLDLIIATNNRIDRIETYVVAEDVKQLLDNQDKNRKFATLA